MENFPEIIVEPKSSNGIQLCAKLTKKYNLMEFTLNSNPQPIFISPWMQFEPSEMNDERLQIANEIARRVNTYDLLMAEITKLCESIEIFRDESAVERDRTRAVADLWSAERSAAGKPADFSDMPKVWPLFGSNYDRQL